MKNFLILLFGLMMAAILVLPTVAQAPCYSRESAYLKYGMNVRERPTVFARKVGGLAGGTTISVFESERGRQWCWLRIGRSRWVAKTGRVLNAAPVVSEPVVADAPIHVSYPVFDVPAYMAEGLKRAYQILAKAGWLGYVSEIKYIRYAPNNYQPHRCRYACTNDNQRDTIWFRYLKDSDIKVASTLVHEACHLHQYRGARVSECECEHKEHEFLVPLGRSNAGGIARRCERHSEGE